jgi:hypothetical protein
MVIASAGDDNADLQHAAPSLADEARWAIRTHQQDAGGGTATVATVTANRLYLTAVLEYQRGDGLLLYVDIDLSQTNVALATWQIDQLSPDLLAS